MIETVWYEDVFRFLNFELYKDICIYIETAEVCILVSYTGFIQFHIRMMFNCDTFFTNFFFIFIHV